MKLTIDLAQSPIALRKELDDAVRFALGTTFYIDQADNENFTATELANPAINVPNGLPALPLVPSALAPLTPNASGATAAPVASSNTAVELDTAGHPYDVRIHSAGKSKIANGTWKLKKGVDKTLVDQINAQNKSLIGQPLPTTAPITITASVAGPSTVSTLPTLPAGAAALPSLPPVLPIPDAEIVVTDYPSFAQFVAQCVVKFGQKATDELNRGLTHYGLVDPETQTPQLPLMAHRADIVEPFYKWFKLTLGA